METLKEFISELSIALNEKKQELDKKILPNVHNNYNIQSTALRAIRSILLKKRTIHNDPYQYDSRMTEIEIPATDNFSDSERAGAIGARLAHYETMLDFLNNSYQFTTEFLIPKRISLLMQLNKTFLWSNFSNTSTHLNTKALAEIINNIFQSSDTLSTSLLRDSLSQLAKTNDQIEQALKVLTVFHREEYKLLVRNEIMPDVSISPEDTINPSNSLKEIKKIFNSKLKKTPFYMDLIIEVIKEDYGNDSLELHKEIFNRLASEKKEKEIIHTKEDYRTILVSSFRVLGNTAPHFKMVLDKIRANQTLIYKSNSGLVKKIARAFRHAFNLPDPEHEIPVMISDPITQTKKKQIINYNNFEKELIAKINLFQNIAKTDSGINGKLKLTADETLVNMLSKYINESNELMKQIIGLDEFYKNVNSNIRDKIRGVKIEITTITNYLLKANQLRAEYNNLVDEIEQMKKLGIYQE